MSLIDDKWELLFERYDIDKEVSKNGLFYITADQIREFKEPRLMTKFDTRESLPKVFDGKLGILPVTRGKYVIGEFDLYEDFPDTRADIKRIGSAKFPDYFETVDLNDIRSEAGAINVMGITGILGDFLGEEGLCQTVSGRMGSGLFSFQVKSKGKGIRHEITVNNSQIEIDGGFENRNIFAIIEGKNVVHSNFLVRQLYYPLRLWDEKIKKPIKAVFMVYSNNIFRLMEYEFTDRRSYHSVHLLREMNYSLEDTDISMEELHGVWREARVMPKPEPDIPFIQADSFEKVISLTEKLNDSPMTGAEIADLFGFRGRQSDYYFNACRYLGLAAKDNDEDGVKKVFITKKGEALLRMKYKRRQLEYARLILKHQIFSEMFEVFIRTGQIPGKDFIAKRMRELHLCGDSLVDRRASSVSGWLKWIVNLKTS